MNLDVWVVQNRISVKNHPINYNFQFIYGSYDFCELNLLMIMEHHQICYSFTEWEEKQFFGCKLCKKSRITEYMLLIALIVLYVNDHQVSFSNEWKNKNFLIKCILLLFLIIKTAAGGIME